MRAVSQSRDKPPLLSSSITARCEGAAILTLPPSFDDNPARERRLSGTRSGALRHRIPNASLDRAIENMSTPKESIRLSRSRKALFAGLSLLIPTLVFVVSAEAILRAMGAEPWRVREISIEVHPGGKFFTKHPILGYSHIPGEFEVTLRTGYTFHVTHLPNTLRITHPIEQVEEEGGTRTKEEIWIFGCSYTHGWSLNDEETYAWLLQERLPEHEIVNFGVSGYGTIHSLLQFRDALEARTPRVALLVYAQFHDDRNTFSRSRRKRLAPWNRLGPLVQPYARFDRKGELRHSMADVVYPEFPLMRHLALAHFIEQKYNELEARWLRSHAVSESLVEEMADLAREHGVDFIVANIQGPDEMMKFAEKNGIANVDISVDDRIAENTNRPHDPHPSALANRQFADRLEPVLRRALLGQPAESISAVHGGGPSASRRLVHYVARQVLN